MLTALVRNVFHSCSFIVCVCFFPILQGLPADNRYGTPAVKGAGAQSLLLCCWHAMKEISLLMGLLVGWAPISDNPNSLLTPTQVCAQNTVSQYDALLCVYHIG